MSEPIFFKPEGGLSLEVIVALTSARPPANAGADLRISDVAPPERAGPNDITFVELHSGVAVTQAGACFVRGENIGVLAAPVLPLVVPDPFRAFVLTAQALYPGAARPSSLFETQGRAESALVHASARIEIGVTIDPAAVIGPRAEIGSGTIIGPMAVIGPDVRIGRGCSIGASASITNALLGDYVVISAGCRIGQQAPFEARRDTNGPATGRVILQDRSEIGANCTIDRGSYRDTVIGEGTRVDNLMHIGGDVMIGRYCKIAVPESLQPSEHLKSPWEGPLADGIMIADSAVRPRLSLHADKARQ